MVDINKAVVARLKRKNHVFEVLVDCEAAISFKEGKGDLDKALVTDQVFYDVKKGERANEHELTGVFGSKDNRLIAEVIIREGEVQLSKEYKDKLREEKKKRIIGLISRNAIDPKTGMPHPVQRIEKVINDAGVMINEFKSAEEQVQDVVKKLREVLPISYELREVLVIIPSSFIGQCVSVIKKIGTLLREDWGPNGELRATVEVPAGLQAELFDKLNNIAHGHVEYKVVKSK